MATHTRRNVLKYGALGLAGAALGESLGTIWAPKVGAAVGSWTQQTIAQTWFTEFAFNGTYVYGGGDDEIGIYRSSTGDGSSWSRLSKSSTVPLDTSAFCISVSPANNTRLLASDDYGRGIVRSHDSGSTWVTINGGLPAHNGKVPRIAMVQHSPYAATPNYAWAACAGRHPGYDAPTVTGGGVYVCYDTTAATPTWFTFGLAGKDVAAVLQHPGNPAIVLAGVGGRTPSVRPTCASSDLGVWRYDGSAWGVVPVSGVTSGAVVANFATDPFGSGSTMRTWVALQLTSATASGGGVAYSNDCGATWTMCTGLPSTGLVWGVKADPTQQNRVYAFIVRPNGAINVYKSTNGTSFTACSAVGPGGSGVLAIGMGVSPAGAIYVGTYGQGTFRSTNQGATWLSVDAGMSHSYGFTSVNVKPGSPTRLLAAGENSADGSSGIWQSSNGGTTWTTTTRSGALQNDFVYELARDPFNSSRVLAAITGQNSSRGVWMSTDDGGSWTRLALPSWHRAPSGGSCSVDEDPGTRYSAVTFHPSTPNVVWVGTSDGIAKLTLGTTPTWSALQMNGNWISAIRFRPDDATKIFVATGGVKFSAYTVPSGFWWSNNSGTSWTQRPFLTDRAGYDVLFVPAWGSQYAYFVHQGGLTLSGLAGEDASGATLVGLLNRPNDVGASAAIDATYGIYYAGYNYVQGTPTDLLYTASAGTGTWNSIASGLTTREITALAVDQESVHHHLYATSFGAGFWERGIN